MRRREFITMLGGAAAMPLVARAQQPGLPVIGFLDTRSSDGMTSRLASFRQGLKEVGIVEGGNVMVIYRWAEDRVDRLPDMARELAQQATVIVTTGGPLSAFAAKEATTQIPIVFLVGDDPVRLGLVSSLARPGGNLTGINMLANELEANGCSCCINSCPKPAACRPREPSQYEQHGKDVTRLRTGSSHDRSAVAGA